MKEHLAGEKTDKLNEELVKEYLENMEKNVENAIKFCNKNSWGIKNDDDKNNVWWFIYKIKK